MAAARAKHAASEDAEGTDGEDADAVGASDGARARRTFEASRLQETGCFLLILLFSSPPSRLQHAESLKEKSK